MRIYHKNLNKLIRRLVIAVLLTSPFYVLAQYNNLNWANVDRHAINVPAYIEADPQTLGHFLGKPFVDRASKLRAVYRWITEHMQYDTESYRLGRQNNQTAQQALAARVATCDGFSNLFEELAKHAGAPVLTVTGYVKDALHQKGEGFNDTNHSWNLVQLDGKWLLIDSTWGAGFDDGVRFIKRFDPFYFLISPEELALTHYARENQHRIGQDAENLGEFLRRPYAPATLLALTKLGNLDINRAQKEGFVKTYDIPRGSITLRKGHIHQTLNRLQQFNWEIESSYFEEFAVIHNEIWVYFNRNNGGLFTANHTPIASGKVQLAAKRLEDKLYTIFLEYGVGK